jgi:hypothetical protein
MNAIPGIKYFWYDVPEGGTPIHSEVNSIIVTKNDSPEQVWYIEVEFRNVRLSVRYRLSILKSENCGTTDPKGCAVDGYLLFREDFGGNNTSDPRVSPVGLPPGKTTYPYIASDRLESKHYSLVKYIDPESDYAWHKGFSDHTHPNDRNRGYMFLTDANTEATQFYQTQITGLCDNVNHLYFSAWVLNIIPTDNKAPDDPILKFVLTDDNGNIVGKYITPTIPRDKPGEAKWRSYGFSFDPQRFNSLTLTIYNQGFGSNGNDFVMDDIEVRLCAPPVKMESRLTDTICAGTPFTFKASYDDVDKAFTNMDGRLAYRWEYSKNGIDWTAKGADTLITDTTIRSIYTVSRMENENDGFYRFIVSSPGGVGSPACRATSAVSKIRIIDITQQSDLRIFVKPTATEHNVLLTSYLDTMNFNPVKWENYANHVPDFSNSATGALDAGKFTPEKVYSYKYTVSSECGSSSAKAYLFTSTNRIPANNRQIFVCKDLKMAARIQLNQILGLENNGQWSYPVDSDGVVKNNVTVSSAEHAGASIFNAAKAYEEAAKNTTYDVPEKPANKAFKFKFTAATGEVYEFTLIVGAQE